MKKILSFLKRYPLSILSIAAIWYGSFFSHPHTPLDDLTLFDKWAHMVMYCTAGIAVWYEYSKQHLNCRWINNFAVSSVGLLLMSGIIEILQEYCTNGVRHGDWLDMAANGIGVGISTIVGTLHKRHSQETA